MASNPLSPKKTKKVVVVVRKKATILPDKRNKLLVTKKAVA